MPHQCTECGRTFADGSKEMLSGCPDCGGNKFQFTPASDVDDTSRGGDTGPSTTQSTASSTQSTASSTQSTASSTQPNSRADADDGRTDWPTHGDEPEAAQRSKPVSPTEADDYRRSSATPEPTEADASTGASPNGSPDQATEPADDRETTEFVESDTAGTEDSAQASARSDVVSPDELSVANRDAGQSTDERDAAPPETTRDADGPGPSDTDQPSDTDHPPADHERPELDDLREELNDQFESIRIVSPGKYELNLMELYDRQEYIISLQEDGRYVIEMPNSIEDRGE
ncbi:OapC/ArvC family zinc-ribbon domain-containing protein [Haloparvum sp. PAK95]|uniref:Zn-ribbon domain-containing protein n=1 Tax=Haloparvum sp. PAK95 TaxID=3418962 RepID=UPI003D2EDFAA